jgi:molybdenum cofactor biosynthesis protein B
MSESADQHRAQSPEGVACAVITISDTRTEKTDRGGPLIESLLKSQGHTIAQLARIPDEPLAMRELLQQLVARDSVDAILMTGGTGIGSRDVTFETIGTMITKPLPGYGELFRMLSFQDVGAAAMLSRAVGGLIGNKVVLTMPGSPAAVRLAMEKLILPELGHLVREARR